MALAVRSTSSVFDGRVPYPEFASIETTMKCNLQCPMCLPYLEGSTVLGRHMEVEDFEPIARALFPYVDWFQLTVSGEPLMSKGLDRMLALAAEYGVRTEYYTNGTLLNDRMISLILPTLGQVCISFDGATSETFDYLRAGATFGHVLRNVERLAAAVQKVPANERPVIGLAVTLLERNIRELPALVELAHRLGLDFVVASHVFPVIPEMQRQSLAHHVELAQEWIGKALARAEELGVPLHVQPLDQVIVAMASSTRPSGTTDRPIAVEDGVVAGLGPRVVNEHRRRPRPGPPLATESARTHVAARASKRLRTDVIEVRDRADLASPTPDSIWFCDFLWNRIYVTADGTVRPCCVPGAPDIAQFRGGDLGSVWDNDAYRAMRIGLVRKEPVPVCRGCQHIRVVTDTAEIARALQGRSMPPPVPLPSVLRPTVEADDASVDGTSDRPRISATPPVIEWPSRPGAGGYAFESVTQAAGKRLRFDTAHRGIELTEPHISVPAWMWNWAPAGVLVEWHAIAEMPRERLVVARGCIVRVDSAELPVVGHEAIPVRDVVQSIAPPAVHWHPAPGATGYEFQASLDDFEHVAFTTLDSTGILADASFQIPDEAWAKVPTGAPLSWRALAIFPDRREVLVRGVFVRQ